jgi:ferredoxin-NADP reductase
VRKHNASEKDEPLNLDVMVDGSYGQHMINLDSSEYKVFVLISGGIGITPNQSLYNNLISQVERGRKLRKVFFIWAVKDRALVNSMTPDVQQSLMGADATPLSFQPGMSGNPPCDIKVSKIVPNHKNDKDIEMVKAPQIVPNENSKDIEMQKTASEMLFENRFYLTRVRDENEFQSANIDPVAQPWLKFGRPDMPALFEEIRSMLREETSPDCAVTRVAVSVCGPQQLMDTVQDLCRLSTGKDIVFDCHTEVFDM